MEEQFLGRQESLLKNLTENTLLGISVGWVSYRVEILSRI
jgi:hypothetical protein